MYPKVGSLHLTGERTISGRSPVKNKTSGHTGRVRQCQTQRAFVHILNNSSPHTTHARPYTRGKARECSIGWTPLCAAALPALPCISLTTAPWSGLSSLFYGWGNRHTEHWVLCSRPQPTKWQKRQLNLLQLNQIPMSDRLREDNHNKKKVKGFITTYYTHGILINNPAKKTRNLQVKCTKLWIGNL